MFSKNLKYFRLKNSLTKKELAEKAKVSPMAITYYENGERMPSMDIMKRLAEPLNVRVLISLPCGMNTLYSPMGNSAKTHL